MRILSVSDYVVNELLDSGSTLFQDRVDLILGCGDLPPEYLQSLHIHYKVPVLYVLGNHDLRHKSPPAGCIELTRKIFDIHGKTFLGFSGSRWYNGNINQFREHEMRSQIRGLWFRLWRLKKLDVVITHAPPRHIHDAEDRCHKGFRCYRRLIDRQSPRYFIHGHIHTMFDKPSDRISLVGNTQVINTYGFHTFEI